MQWNYFGFVQALNECHDYRKDPVNSWCTWWSKNPMMDAVNAWRLYQCALKSSLGMLILGSAKIRKDPAGCRSGSSEKLLATISRFLFDRDYVFRGV
jgi:hypothetical protein